MNRQLSSFRVDDASAPSARERGSRWPWLLASGPAIVVVASLATAWLAATRADPVVADDYYKLGLTINRRLAASPPHVPDVSATLNVTRDGRIRLHVDEASASPSRVTLSIRHPGEGSGPVVLAATGERDWTGSLADARPGLRIVSVESDAWQLPVTVIEQLPATIRLGNAETALSPSREDAKR